MKKTSLYLFKTRPSKFQALASNNHFLRLDKGGISRIVGDPAVVGWASVADWRLGSWNEDPFDLS